jgi:RHS repeat-associated protein
MKRYLALLALFLVCKESTSQTNLIFSSYVSPNNYTNQQRITLLPGMSANGAAGNSRLYIDPAIQLNSSFTSAGSYGTNPVVYNLDISKPVGTIPYSFNVSPLGSAECSVPIDCPIGTSNMKPSLSFNYSSFSGSGELGMGWSIGGLQKISRIGNSIYHNGNVTPIGLTNADNFVLNGNRMFVTTGANGANASIYNTEQNVFARITSNGTTGSGPTWFKVETKEGLILEFGNTSASRLIPVNATTVLEWYLNKVSDQNGNYMTYDYFNSTGEILIKEVAYTGNAIIGAPYNSIKFYYNLRSNKNTVYVSGGEVNERSILRIVEVKQENNVVAQYSFNYVTYFNNSYLIEINLKGNDSQTLNGLKFSYQNDVGAPLAQTATGLNSSFFYSRYLFLDFTGDGKKDAIAFDWTTFNAGYVTYVQYTNWRTLQNNGASSFSQVGSVNTYPSTFDPYIPFMYLSSSNGAVGNFIYSTNDFNGDNKEDFLLKYTGTTSDMFYIYISNGAGFNAPQIFTIQKNSSASNPYWIMDLDGDMKLDLLYCDKGGSNPSFFAVMSVATAANVTYANGNPLNFTNLNVDNTKILDLNGDGKSELLISNSGVTAYSIIGLSSLGALQINPITTSAAFSTIDHPNYTTLNSAGTYQPYGSVSIGLDGDYNGDGKTDIITSTVIGGSSPISYKFELFLNKGDGTFTSPILLNKSGLGLQNFFPAGYFYYTSDMNGDGKTDILEISTGQLKIYFSKGVDGSDYFFSETYNIGVNKQEFVVTDVDGNGVNDIVSNCSSCFQVAPTIIYFYKGGISKNIKEVVDGFGRKTEVVSAPLTDASVYTQPAPLNAQAYPLSVMNSPLYVVKQVKTPDGIGGTVTENYAYENGIVHKKGKGLLCFSKITKTNAVKDYKVVEEYGFDAARFNMYLTKTSNYALALNQLLSTQVITNQAYTYGLWGYFPYVSTILETNLLQSYSTFKQSTIDNNGNVLYTDKNINSGLNREETTYSSFVSNGSWMLSKPGTVNVTISRTGQTPSYVRNTSYVYDAFGHIQTIAEEPGNTKSVVKTHVYDANSGVLTSVSISAPNSGGLPVKTTSYVYDPKHRLPIQEINPLNQVSQTKYNFIWGKPVEVTDAEGLKTTYTYDAYGRDLTMTTADNNTTQYAYNWVTPADFAGGDPLSTSTCLYKLMVKIPGNSIKKSYYDLFDREVRKEFEGFDGTKHYSMLRHNAKGLKASETGLYQLIPSNPFTPIITTYGYDYLTRITSAVSTDGTNTRTKTYAYTYVTNNLVITTTEPDGKVATQTMDPSGLATIATDNGGTINYTYGSNRKVALITVNSVQANKMTYDIFGRQTKLEDRDAGIILYDYNAYGQLASQTDANNKTYNYTYDVLDRMLTKAGPDGTYSYQYVTSGSGLNNILQETAGNGYYTKYYYDLLGRNNKIEENIAGQTYATTYFFDQYNRIEKIKYPSNFTTKNIYNTFGHLAQVTDDGSGQAIWTGNSNDPLGQVANYTTGNGKTTQISRNNFGILTQNSTPSVQSFNYNFNFLNHNLNSRTDNILVKTESFTYDNLNRLTQAQITGLPNFNATYNSAGNVLTKTGLGNISYKTSKPDAVNNVDNTSGIINTAPTANNQNISYTPFNKVQNIIEGNYQYDVFYGSDQQRRMANMYISGSLDYTRVYVGNYEKTTQGVNTTEVHYINSPAGLCATYVITNGTGVMYYPYLDHLGTITKVTDASGTIVANLNYDAWGRRRNNTTWDYVSPSSPPIWLYRGYTGHEHLPEFALVNMNGRLYDPILGQMLSPDRFNQMPNYTQNYNRYAYAYNNPLKYNDPSGNIFGTIGGAVKSAYSTVTSGGLEFWNGGQDYVKDAWAKSDPTMKGTAFNTGVRIDAGLFKTDPNRNNVGRALQLLSRFTWELPQTVAGNIYSSVRNVRGNVTDVSYYGGATLVNQKKDGEGAWGATLGSYINSQNVVADPYTDELFRHEYGHTLQSRAVGLFYLPFVAAPSSVGAFLDYNVGINNHDQEWYETNANRMSRRYFNNHDQNALDESKGGTSWNYSEYPTNYVFNWYTIPSIIIIPAAVLLIIF